VGRYRPGFALTGGVGQCLFLDGDLGDTQAGLDGQGRLGLIPAAFPASSPIRV
jgi:hypothetical protein